ncbi:MAG: TlpA disulfide reductase family protein [Chitinophagaceae bacterium]
MKMILIRFTGFLFLGLVLIHCKPKNQESFTVTVNYSHLNKMIPGNPQGDSEASKPPLMLLEEIPYGGDANPIILDSAAMTADKGKIVLQGNGKEEAIYQLAVQNGPIVLLINDEDNITVDIDLGKKDDFYTVKGSKASNELKDFIRLYGERTSAVNKTFAHLDSLKQLAASDSAIILATENKNNAVKGLNDYLLGLINRSEHPSISLFALGLSSRSFQQADFEKSLNDVVKRFPDHAVLENLKSNYELQKAQVAEQEKKKAGNSWVGKKAPDLALATAEGKTVSITSFKGKYLLVDFWASWCGPCRQENPNVVKAYNQYKDKNFTILGVSLDKEKDPWLKAIKDDQLAWTHVSDLKYWNSKAVDVYKFEGIPFNVLIDPQGNIVAENLRGFDLEKRLEEVLQ